MFLNLQRDSLGQEDYGGGPVILSRRFLEALGFAAELHLNQRRKGTDIPYVSHILAVASIVMESGGTEDEVIAALLHDAVEDRGGRPMLEQIRARFGEAVAAIVEGCTDTYVEPKPAWKPRKEAYIAHLRDPRTSPSVRRVSAADKLHNARTILWDYRQLGERLWSRFSGGREGTLWYYRAVVEALRAAGLTPVIQELEDVVQEIESLATVGAR